MRAGSACFRAGRACVGGFSPTPLEQQDQSPEEGTPPPAPTATQYLFETVFQRPEGALRVLLTAGPRVHPLSEREKKTHSIPHIKKNTEANRPPSVEVNRAAADRLKRSRRVIGLLHSQCAPKARTLSEMRRHFRTGGSPQTKRWNEVPQRCAAPGTVSAYQPAETRTRGAYLI